MMMRKEDHSSTTQEGRGEEGVREKGREERSFVLLI